MAQTGGDRPEDVRRAIEAARQAMATARLRAMRQPSESAEQRLVRELEGVTAALENLIRAVEPLVGLGESTDA